MALEDDDFDAQEEAWERRLFDKHRRTLSQCMNISDVRAVCPLLEGRAGELLPWAEAILDLSENVSLAAYDDDEGMRRAVQVSVDGCDCSYLLYAVYNYVMGATSHPTFHFQVGSANALRIRSIYRSKMNRAFDGIQGWMA